MYENIAQRTPCYNNRDASISSTNSSFDFGCHAPSSYPRLVSKSNSTMVYILNVGVNKL
uniref:Delta-1-pyrroline-5-carboxylate synthetase n=1 Tax=Rhizophora mucronata TaxID=61149 RepID=A0A2P2MBC0_RHIMU